MPESSATGASLRRPRASCAGALLALAWAACSPFEEATSPDVTSCSPTSCGDAGPSCRVYDFSGACPSEWTFGGNKDLPAVVGECSGGKLRLAADDTLDITAELSLTTPGQLDAARVSARIAVKSWDGGKLLRVMLENKVLIELRAVMAASGNPRISFCDPAGACAPRVLDTQVGEEHGFIFEVTSTSIDVSVDCRSVAKLPSSIPLAPNARLAVVVGKTDANPAIDATLDDVVVSYR